MSSLMLDRFSVVSGPLPLRGLFIMSIRINLGGGCVRGKSRSLECLNGRPEKDPDVGLSLLEYGGLKAIDPAYALPVDV
ncbi:hypothetical protein Tsubulata_023072, partial [Turnera subulata]